MMRMTMAVFGQLHLTLVIDGVAAAAANAPEVDAFFPSITSTIVFPVIRVIFIGFEVIFTIFAVFVVVGVIVGVSIDIVTSSSLSLFVGLFFWGGVDSFVCYL